LKFEELPEIPKTWCEFLRGQAPFAPPLESVSELARSATTIPNRRFRRDVLSRYLDGLRDRRFDRIRENLSRLREPETVVVSANLYPALFGGPVCQFLKCLTVVRICGELGRHNLTAVPVCWMCSDIPKAFPQWAIQILDHESRIRVLNMEHQDPWDRLPKDEAASLLSLIDKSGRGDFDPETLEILRSSFAEGESLARASALLFEELFKQWGIAVMDSRALDLKNAVNCVQVAPQMKNDLPIPYAILPVVATVVDPFETDLFAGTLQSCRENNWAVPTPWPQASATFIDNRSSRVLQRYGLGLSRLYAGAETIIDQLAADLPRDVPEKLDRLKTEAETRIAGISSLSSGRTFTKAVHLGREKIGYQLNRLKESFESAIEIRERTLYRRIHEVCNSLAPGGRIQELGLAGIQLPLRYSPGILQSLCEKLDILSREHQLISVE
jgi:uncharacterized protein YllA (UPF0747 family)